MTGSTRSAPDDGDRNEEHERRLRAAQLLGEVLPSVTGDETSAGWGEPDPATRDEELLRDVPPHHAG